MKLLGIRMLWAIMTFSICQYVYAQESDKLFSNDNIQITRLDKLNSDYRETNLSISPDGQYLFWMSGRGGQSWSTSWTKTDLDGKVSYDGDIWYANRQGDGWSQAQCMSSPVNTSSGEDEPNISPNGRYVYYQSWSGWTSSGGPYYRAEFQGNSWGKRRGFGGGIHKFFRKMMSDHSMAATDGATVSPDGRTFIVAAGPEYTGNMDLYISRRGKNGWSYPKKLSVNTPKDERSAFLAADGRTLYFASNGYGGAGGLDIFKTTIMPDGSCSPPINIGAPFNTPANDYNLVLTASGESAFFIRKGDIYYADISEAPDSLKPEPTILIKGAVKDSLQENPIQASVELADSTSGEILQTEKTHPKTGEYVFVVPDKEQTYELKIKAPNYKPRKRYVSTKRPKGSKSKRNLSIVLKEDVPMVSEIRTVADPNSLVSDLDTAFFIYFASDVDTLNAKAISDMRMIISLMKQYKAGQVKLLGHTDSKGTNTYNLALSQRRVKSVSDYLINRKYPAKRIVASHYGETKPVAENQTMRGMQLNRRVEVRFKVRKE